MKVGAVLCRPASSRTDGPRPRRTGAHSQALSCSQNLHSRKSEKMSLRALVVAAAISFIAAQSPAAPPAVGLYDLYEVTFSGPRRPTAEIDGTFRHLDSGRTITMPAFWDGGTTWRCRFAPTQLGRWTYSVGGKQGEILCVESDNPGFIHAAGRHFRFSSGRYIHILGNTHYDLLSCSDDVIEKYILWNKGAFNKIRFAVVTQRYHGPVKAFEPGDDEDSYNFEKPRPRYWRKLDRTVARMQSAGIIADLILAGPDITYEQLKDNFYKRYVVARYAAFSNVWWCMGNEIHSKGRYTPADVTRAASFIAALDPYDHPRSVHEQAEWFYANEKWPTHVIFQMKNPRIADQRRLVLSVRHLGIPVINDEPAYQGEIVDGGSIRAFWGCIMACGYGSSGQKTGRKTGPYFPNKNLPPDAFKNPKNAKGWYVREQARIVQSFMAMTEWWKMNQVGAIAPECFARYEPGRQWLVLVGRGRTCRVDLRSAKGRDLPIRYYDIQATDVESAIKSAGSTRGAAWLSLKARPDQERIYLIGGKNM